MPTVSNIASRVSLFTGLQNTGTEETLILEFMNEAYQQAVEESECYTSITTLSYASDLESVDADSATTGIIRIIDVSLSDYNGYSRVMLKPLSRSSYSDEVNLSSGSSGIPRFYSFYNTSSGLQVALYPRPSSDATIEIEYVAVPPVLVKTSPSAGQETTPSAIPSYLHHRVISAGAIAMCFDREQRLDKSQQWWDRFDQGVRDLAARENELHGSRQIDHFFDDSLRIGDDDRSRDLP